MLWKEFRSGYNLPTHTRENTDLSLQKPQQLRSTQVNFEGCLMVKYYMVPILLYCIKR